jgi:hypothetical protein
MKPGPWVLALCAAATLGACAQSQQARETEATSGFLGNAYPMLREGNAGEALLLYRRDGVNWPAYRQVHLAPVTIWVDPSAFRDFAPADRQALANRFYAVTYAELEKDYQMVAAPAPGVLEVQLALVDAQTSNPTLDTVSTVMPMGLAASTLTGLMTGKPSFVGEAQAEGRVLDGTSGELLAAAVDRRVGGKSVVDSVDSWGDVDAAFQYWAQQLRYRLCTDRGAGGCVPPE